MSAVYSKFSFDDDCVLHFAMRYALGRKTGAPAIVCKVLKRDWSRFAATSQRDIQTEIRSAISEGRAGDPCDVREWRGILDLPIGEE